MFRKIAAIISGLILAALLLGGTASADEVDPYPAPLVTPSVSVEVAGASSSVAAVAQNNKPANPAAAANQGANPAGANIEVRGATQSLSYTGAGFQIGTAIAIGAAIVLAGLALVLVGSRRTFGASKNTNS